MRVVVLAALGIVVALFAGSWAQLLQIGGIPVDIVLLAVVSLALLDGTTTPITFAVYTGLLVDIMYSTVVGCSALADTASAAAVFFVARRADRINLLIVIAAGGAAYLLKNVIMAVLLYAKGIPGLSLSMFFSTILPGAAVAAGLIIPAYWLMSRLMRLRFMRKRRVIVDEF